MGGAPFITIPESFLAKFLLPVSVTLGSISVRRLSSQRKKVSTGAAVKILLNWRMHLPPCPWGFPCQWIRKHYCKDYCPEGAGSGADRRGLPLNDGGEDEAVCNSGDPLGNLLVLLHSMIKASGQQDNSAQTK